MELRLLTPDDRAALAWLMAEAFNAGRRPDPPLPEEGTAPDDLRPSRTTGVFDGTRLVAATTVHDLHVTWGDHDAPLGGVAGVACATDQRGRGHVARLLVESLQAMHEAGQYLSGLYPFAYAFYRRHGWEWVGEKRHHTVPTEHIQAYPEGRHIRVYDGPEALEAVKPIYAAFARRYRGMMTREDRHPDFWNVLNHHDNRTTYVPVYHSPDTGRAEGYAIFRYPTDDRPARVRDFVANTGAAYRGLLSLLHYSGTQISKIRLTSPAEDPLPLHIMHYDVETRVDPLFMGRVVDVSAALKALRPASTLTGRVYLAVSDPSCDWNHRTFAVLVEGGAVDVVPSDSTPGVSLDIQALSQAYWGKPGLALLRFADHVAVTDESQFGLLAALLPSTVPYLMDGF